jgi:hypothetical protein
MADNRTETTEPSKAWPKSGPDFNRWNFDAASFVAAVQEQPALWHNDAELKYLTLTIDVRDGGFKLKDRYGNQIEPDRVVEAIENAKPIASAITMDAEIERLRIENSDLRRAGDRLCLAAQMTGGTAGRDEALCDRITEWVKAASYAKPAKKAASPDVTDSSGCVFTDLKLPCADPECELCPSPAPNRPLSKRARHAEMMLGIARLGFPPGYSGVVFADPMANERERQKAWFDWGTKS